MNDETTPQDSAAMPPASAGSHGSPIAWGIRFWDGTLHGEVFQTFEAADKHLNPPHSPLRREDVTAKVVPLFVSPTLTDAERKAIEVSREFWQAEADCSLGDEKEQVYADALRGLLERTK